MGFVCGRSPKRGEDKPCSACGRPGKLLCDGEGCDVPLCGGCSSQLRAYDRDYCPRCVSAPNLGVECAAGPILPSLPCRGVHVAEAGLCVRHAALFDEWVGWHGGDVVYRGGATRTEKRAAFASWVGGLGEVALGEVLRKRRVA